MIARTPGFVDVPQSDGPEPPPMPEAAQPAPDMVGPILLDAAPGEARAQIDTLWEPEFVATRRSGLSSQAWLTSGLAVLLLSWVALSLVAFAMDQFSRSVGLGVLTLICFGTALSFMTYGFWRELRAFRVLQRVDNLRRYFSRAEPSLAELRAVILPWLHTVRRHLEDPERVVAVLETATSPAEIKSALRREVAGPLRRAAQQAGRRAALQGGAVVAITPTPALEGILVGIRGLLLIRRIAGIYGIRPGTLVTLALLRRIAWTAAGVSGLALLSQTLTEHTLQRVPIVKHLAGALPVTSLAAVRLYRLASITAEACSPVPRGSDDW